MAGFAVVRVGSTGATPPTPESAVPFQDGAGPTLGAAVLALPLLPLEVEVGSPVARAAQPPRINPPTLANKERRLSIYEIPTICDVAAPWPLIAP